MIRVTSIHLKYVIDRITSIPVDPNLTARYVINPGPIVFGFFRDRRVVPNPLANPTSPSWPSLYYNANPTGDFRDYDQRLEYDTMELREHNAEVVDGAVSTHELHLRPNRRVVWDLSTAGIASRPFLNEMFFGIIPAYQYNATQIAFPPRFEWSCRIYFQDV